MKRLPATRVLLLVSCLLSPLAMGAGDPEAAKRIRADVETLASPAMQGRRAGSEGAEQASKYLVESFRKIGLLPAGKTGSYLQPFTFIDGVVLGSKNALTTAAGGPLGRTWKVSADFTPLSFSAPGTVAAAVVFAGYGIVAKEPAWDEYAGLDVKGKVVLVLRHGPDGDDPKSPYSPYAALRHKASEARDRGAAALLVATGPLTHGVADDLVALRTDASFSDAGLPVFSVKRAVAESFFPGSGRTLEEAQKAIDSGKKPASFELPAARVELVADLTPHKATTGNVLGILPGSDPARNRETVVVGAHYDHLGMGGSGSLETEPKIHPGADDNASGVAAMLELARRLAAERGKLARSVLFAAFSAEEVGDLGSLHFVKDPTVPASGIVAMVNLDMVGRLRNDSLDVSGAGTSPAFKPLIAKAAQTEGLKTKLGESGYGPSDNASFYTAGVPVLFLFTGNHADYHRSTDTADKISYEGESRIVRFALPILEAIATAEKRPEYVKLAADPAAAGAARGFRVWVGTIPDYSDEGPGLRITGVTPGSPAEKAGLAGNDVIVRFAGKEIRNVYDYTYALQGLSPGDKVEAVVKRSEEGKSVEKTFTVTVLPRPSSTR
jgi:hypothetical protein